GRGRAGRSQPRLGRVPGGPPADHDHRRGQEAGDPSQLQGRDLRHRRRRLRAARHATQAAAGASCPQGTHTMKITHVHLTLFAWDDIPATRYGIHTGTFSGASQLGLLTIETDDGVRGHAFLGSAMRGAHLDGQSLIQYLKPVVLGQDPMERERLYQAMWQKNRGTTYRAIGAMDIALWDIAGKTAGQPIHRLLGSYRES